MLLTALLLLQTHCSEEGTYYNYLYRVEPLYYGHQFLCPKYWSVRISGVEKYMFICSWDQTNSDVLIS